MLRGREARTPRRSARRGRPRQASNSITTSARTCRAETATPCRRWVRTTSGGPGPAQGGVRRGRSGRQLPQDAPLTRSNLDAMAIVFPRSRSNAHAQGTIWRRALSNLTTGRRARHSGRCDAALYVACGAGGVREPLLAAALGSGRRLHSPFAMLAGDTYPARSERESAPCPYSSAQRWPPGQRPQRSADTPTKRPSVT
jgi:hypothetical protein